MNKNRVVLFLSLSIGILLLMFVMTIFFSTPIRVTTKNPPPSTVPSINFNAVTLYPTPTSTPLQNPNKQSLIAKMPVVTPEYSIEYLQTTDTFIVLVRQSPFDVNKAKAQDWFRQNGVSDLQTLNIFYTKLRIVQ